MCLTQWATGRPQTSSRSRLVLRQAPALYSSALSSPPLRPPCRTPLPLLLLPLPLATPLLRPRHPSLPVFAMVSLNQRPHPPSNPAQQHSPRHRHIVQRVTVHVTLVIPVRVRQVLEKQAFVGQHRAPFLARPSRRGAIRVGRRHRPWYQRRPPVLSILRCPPSFVPQRLVVLPAFSPSSLHNGLLAHPSPTSPVRPASFPRSPPTSSAAYTHGASATHRSRRPSRLRPVPVLGQGMQTQTQMPTPRRARACRDCCAHLLTC